MRALGMIEVIGLPPAIEAADAALKAANVELIAIAKADAGILTVEITGDVGAVSAAVEAGAAAAERVGTLRAKHIIPRVDESLVGKVIMQGTKLFQSKKNTVHPIVTAERSKDEEDIIKVKVEENIVNRAEDTLDEKIEDKVEGIIDEKIEDAMKEKVEDIIDEKIEEKREEITEIEEIKEKKDVKKTEELTFTAAELKKKSNDTLRTILQSKGVEITEQLRSAKKQELIQLILMTQNHR